MRRLYVDIPAEFAGIVLAQIPASRFAKRLKRYDPALIRYESTLLAAMNKPLRVLIITARADHGGGPRHVEMLLRHFPPHVQAHVASPDEAPYRQRYEHLALGRTVTIPHRQFRIGAAVRLSAYVKRYRIALVHTHGKGAGIYGRLVSLLTGRPCIHTPHGVHVAQYSKPVFRLYRAYENRTAWLVRHLLFVSEEERDSARAHGLWPGCRYSVIPNGVEAVAPSARRALRAKTRRSLNIAPSQPTVVTLSRFNHQKNMAEAYEIARHLPDVLFLWVGDGPEAAGLKEKLATDKVNNIRLLGSRDDPSPILACADVYLSTSRWEGLPLALLEAMAMALPIVASDVVGHRELVEGAGAGCLYAPGAADEAADLLRTFFSDMSLLAKLGGQGQDVQRERYSAACMADAVSETYREAAAAL